MKEILIHQDSKLLYAQNEQSFVYVCEQYELVLFGCEGVYVNHGSVGCQEHDCMILQKHQIYSFHLPPKGILLITRLPMKEEEPLHNVYASFFQHEEIQALCILLGNLSGAIDEKSQLLYQSYHARLGFLVLNSYTYFGDTKEEHSVVNGERLKKIQEILRSHLSEEVTLVDLSKQLHLTPQYVSQYFKKNFGMSFLHYRNRMKLHGAMQDIQEGTLSFLNIAMRYGFANVRSFQSAFMECFHCTPKQYRVLLQQRSIHQKGTLEDEPYVRFMRDMKEAIPATYRNQFEKHYRLQFDAKGEQPIAHTWRNLMTVGRARLLLVDDIRRQLGEIQQEIGFRMIRFHGIFNDDMHVYEEDEHGQAFYNFHQVNEALDFILKLGLKPFVELGFMPSMLAKYPDMTILNRMFLVSPPKDMKKWQELIRAFLRNCINRYGLDEVSGWYFEFWNNAGLDNQEGNHDETLKMKFWQESATSYLEFYAASYEAVKSIHPQLRIGGPSVDISLIIQKPEYFHFYIQYLKKHQCMIDFLTLHMYPLLMQLETQEQLLAMQSQTTKLTTEFKKTIADVKSYLKKQKLGMEVHFTEWSTWGYPFKSGFNDGCGKAIYMIKSIVDTLDEVPSLGHWTFSDYTETMKTRESKIYSDNVGLFTSNGIKKAAYHAYTLLNKMGDVLLDKGDFHLFTRKQKNYQLLLFHMASCQETMDEVACFQIAIQGMENGTYEKKVYFLNEQSGSSYDCWKQMGSHQDMMEEDVQYLKAHALMSYVREMMSIQQHQTYETRRLKHQEAILIEWNYKY